MKLPFLWISLGFSLGILVEKCCRIPLHWLASILGGGIILLCFLTRKKIFLPVFLLCMASAGIFWARLDAQIPANEVRNFAGAERITLRGVVDSLPEVKTHGKKTTVSLVLKAHSIIHREGKHWKSQKVSGKVQVFLIQSSVLPQTGDELRLYGELSEPRTVLNPGEFDYKSFLAQKNIYAIFQTIGKKCVRVTKIGNPLAFARILASARRHLARLIDQLYCVREAAIVKALVLGLRSDISPEVRDQFMKTGTIHLLAISGMNITMIAGTFYLIFLFSGMGFRIASGVTVLIMVIYVGLSGAGIPIQRAGYGAVLVLTAALSGRPSHTLNSLCFAFFAILLCDPKSLWNIGFQLSFLCVFSLILILPVLARVNAWTLSLGSSLAVLLGTFPAVLYYFNIFSPVSIVANLAAIPLCDAALFTALFALLFGGVPFLSSLLVKISSWIIAGSLAWVQWLSSWRWGYWFFERPALVLIIVYYITLGMILFLHRRVFLWKRFWLLGLAGIWLFTSVLFFWKPGPKPFELTFLSSGKNQIAHARFSNGSEWLLNAGRNFPSDQGEWLIGPYLRSRGAQGLDGILFTDLSRKHTGGLVSVLRGFPVRNILYPKGNARESSALFADLEKTGRKFQGLERGDGVLMGAEGMRIVGQSQKGIGVLILSGPWRVLVISRWDPELLRLEDLGEIHAVFLPLSEWGDPAAVCDWLKKIRPLLTVFPDASGELKDHLAYQRIAFLDLRDVGAVSFKRKGPRLELRSFLKGHLGFYSFS